MDNNTRYIQSFKKTNNLFNFAEIVATSKRSRERRKDIEWINVNLNIDSSGDGADDDNEGVQNNSGDKVPDDDDGVKSNVKFVKGIFLSIFIIVVTEALL